jgi:UDP-glucose 4-epimerase
MLLDKYRRIIVTGGAGFIGSHICEELLACGKQVIVVDNLSTGKRENIPPGVELHELDIIDQPRLVRVIRGADLVFHMAAQPSTRKSVEDPLLDFNSNVIGTYNVLAAARETRVKKLVYTSSSAVYGEPQHLPVGENEPPVPRTPYGASKLCGEHYCYVFTRVYGLACTCLRPFNVYGPRENLESSLDEVSRYTRAIVTEQPITIYGDGSQTRDFVYVKDVARAHILAADRDESIGRVFNVATGVETSINELVKEIEHLTGIKARVQQRPWSTGEIRREYGDIHQAQEILGFSPLTSLPDGIRELVSDFKGE